MRFALTRLRRNLLRSTSLSACMLVVALLYPTWATGGTGTNAEAIEQAKRATVGILEDTQDPRTPDKPGKIKIRGTGFHLQDGYIVTARHAVEKHSPTGQIVPKVIRVLSSDLHEFVAQIVGDSAYLDVVVYRLNQKDRPLMPISTVFAAEAPIVGSEVFTVGYPMGWGPTMAFGRIGNANTFLQTVETRLVQADLSACSGNSGGGLFNQAGEVVGIMHAVIQTDKDDKEEYSMWPLPPGGGWAGLGGGIERRGVVASLDLDLRRIKGFFALIWQTTRLFLSACEFHGVARS